MIPLKSRYGAHGFDPVGGGGARQAVDSGEGCFLFVAVITALAVWLLAALNQLLFVAVCKSHAPRFVSNESLSSLGRTATPGNHRPAAHQPTTVVTLEDLKLNAPTGKPPLPPRREQPPPPEKGQSLSLSSFSGSTGSLSGSGSGRKSGNTTRLTGAALARHKLKMSLKRGGPPPAASSGSGVMTTSLDQQVQKAAPPRSRAAKK